MCPLTVDILKERYEIQRTLGDRTVQKTWLALDQQTQNQVVIKALFFNTNLKWENVRLFEREAATLKSLHHPCIPQYLDFFDIKTEAGKGFALVQSYINTSSLAQQAEAGRRFSESELKEIARSILKVLIYLHSCQPPVIHRDLKPSNILLSEHPLTAAHSLTKQLYLIDFGAVQSLQSENSTRTVVGTYGYMPPEQFGQRAVPASDLYGLGVTLIYLATGQHPADLPTKRFRIAFEDKTSLSPTFTRWLRQMIEPALEERFVTAQNALDLLDQELLSVLAVQKQSAIAKPADTDVIIYRTSDYIEIRIPPVGFSWRNVTSLVFTFFLTRFSINWAIAAFQSSSVPGVFSMLFLYASICLIKDNLFTIFRSTALRIDEETLSLTYSIFGYNYQRPKPAARLSIDKLEKVPPKYDTAGNHTQKTVLAHINICATGENFTLGRDYEFSSAELDWIAFELGNWTGLPILHEETP